MPQKLKITFSLLAWFGVWVFWLLATRSFHPTFALSIIVTTSLVVAFATMSYINLWILVPRYWFRGWRLQYLTWLAVGMASLTAFALTVIRTSYVLTFGPDSDPYGLYKHYAIDLLGMVVHVAVASLIAWIGNRRVRTEAHHC